jgi:hypothetical protein
VLAVGPPLLAFVIASGVTALELVTSKYPRTVFVLAPSKKSWALYAYSLTYGAIAALITATIGALSAAEIVRLEGLGLSNPWVQAAYVGLTTKAFLHIRLFTTTIGSHSVPIGIETVVQLFEPWLLRTIEIAEFNGVREFLTPRTRIYPDLKKVREDIKDNVPETLPEQERIAFLSDIDEAEDVMRAMELYLKFLGRASFDRVFPERTPLPAG